MAVFGMLKFMRRGTTFWPVMPELVEPDVQVALKTTSEAVRPGQR